MTFHILIYTVNMFWIGFGKGIDKTYLYDTSTQLFSLKFTGGGDLSCLNLICCSFPREMLPNLNGDIGGVDGEGM